MSTTPSPGMVLVVEDNPLSRKVTRLALEAEGYVVHEAGDGRAALDFVGNAAPDLILQDIKLPDINLETREFHVNRLKGCNGGPHELYNGECPALRAWLADRAKMDPPEFLRCALYQ